MKTMTMGSVLAALGAVLSMTSSASALGPASPVTCIPDPGNVSAVVCTIDSGTSPSTFLGAFASDNNGNGGWVEFYSDDEGEWYVEHHENGGTAYGWDTKNIAGPQLKTNQPGGYDSKKRPAFKGAMKTVPKKTYAAAKAAAAKQTGTLTSVQGAAAVSTGLAGMKFGHISMQGSGQCKAQIIVQKDGKVISTTAPMPLSFPSERAVALPNDAGTYQITVKGWDGCMGQSKTGQVTILPPHRVAAR